jgi:SAM-dependent methyltransferase
MRDTQTEAQKTWGASPTGWTSAKEYEPGTREFFDKANEFRDKIEQPWLSDVVPFHTMSGKKVLEIGFGPGYDTLKFMRAGSDYTGIDITPENVERTRRHLAFFGFSPNVRQGDAEDLPFPDATFDIVYSNGVLHHVPDMARAFREARRVLKSGGEFRILLYNRYSVFYAGLVAIHLLSGRFLKESLAQRRSRIEATSAEDAVPIVNVYSQSEVRGLLETANLVPTSVVVRKCTPEDFPGSGKLAAFYQSIPTSLLSSLGKLAGWYIVATAVKR